MVPLRFGRFRTTRLLARTEYADVYEADDDDGRRFALKILRVDGVDTALVDALFQREIAALDGFEHEGIVPLRSFHRETDGRPVLVFDLVPGKQTLDTLLTRATEGVATKAELWRVTEAQRLVAAVGAAHARKVVHRDLKPSNVLVDVDRDQLVICDFGVANVLSHKVLHPGGRTLRDLFTRPYAAPEQCLHGEALYPADVHALSLLVTSLLALRQPGDDFRAVDFPALWEPARRDLRAVAVDEATISTLGDTLRRGLVDAPADRPSLHSLASALEAVRASLTPRPVATLWLTPTAEAKLAELDITPPALADDLNASLSIRLDGGDQGPRIKLYGKSLLAVAAWDSDDERRLRIIDVKVPTGLKLANDRRNARTVALSLQFGRGDGSALITAARQAQGHIQSERVAKLLSLAQRVIDLERERLPVIEVVGDIMNGETVSGGRSTRVTQAAGHRGPAVTRVRVRNARIAIVSVKRVLPPAGKNVLPGPQVDIEPLEESVVPSLFEGFDAMQVVEPMSKHALGKVTRWQTQEDGTVSATVAFEKDEERPRRVRFHVEDIVQRRQLDKQEQAMEQLRERRARLSLLPDLLTLSSAHVLENRDEIIPFQSFLKDDRRVCDIVERVLASTVSCVQGPPGTGKTALIVELVLQLLKRNPRQRILVCSQANEAVSNALERLQEPVVGAHLPSRPWIVRDVRDELRDVAKHEGLEPMFRHEAAALRREAEKVKPELGSAGAHRAIDEWCRDLENAAAETREEFAAHVQVWGATAARSQRTLSVAQGADWDVVIVDEAAKITLAEVLVPLVSARRIVLVGDHKQLPPFLDSVTAEQLEQTGLDPDEAKTSLFQHLFDHVLPETHRGKMLTQSRMHPTIGALVSKLFYAGELRHNVAPEDRPLPSGRFNREHRVIFLGVRGVDERTLKGSRRNPQEAAEIVNVLEKLDEDATRAGQKLTVSVITPYKAQALDLEATVKRDWNSLTSVRAGTVHSFQGRQSDVVIYSLVRTGAIEWRFLADPRLFNVAVSRARSLLVLVGDLDGAPATPLLKQLLELVPSENLVKLADFLG